MYNSQPRISDLVHREVSLLISHKSAQTISNAKSKQYPTGVFSQNNANLWNFLAALSTPCTTASTTNEHWNCLGHRATSPASAAALKGAAVRHLTARHIHCCAWKRSACVAAMPQNGMNRLKLSQTDLHTVHRSCQRFAFPAGNAHEALRWARRA